MIARKYETIVGIFVVASLVALLAMVLIIAQQEGLFMQYVRYRAIFKNVGGLKPGSEVHLAGVTVGSVDTIVITPEGTTVVSFRVQKQYSSQIRQDTQASIGSMGLLGDKSLDLTAGSPGKPPIPPDGLVAVIEPLDITQLLAKAGPSLEKMDTILTNLVTITDRMSKPGGDLSQIMDSLRGIFTKINQGKGTLGQLVNNPPLYNELSTSAVEARKFITGLDKGFFGTMAKTPTTKEETSQAVKDFRAALANASKATGNIQEASTGLPALMKKLDGFLTNLEKAGKGLPSLVTDVDTAASDFAITNKALQKNWLLRGNVPKSQEHTILLDAEPGRK